MKIDGFTWECACGHVENSDEMPEECPKCFRLDSFEKMPEEIVEERKRDIMEEPVRKSAKSTTRRKKK